VILSVILTFLSDRYSKLSAYSAFAVSAIEVFAVEALTEKCCQCVYIQLMHELEECSDKDDKTVRFR